jgi:hypothetical protein
MQHDRSSTATRSTNVRDTVSILLRALPVSPAINGPGIQKEAITGGEGEIQDTDILGQSRNQANGSNEWVAYFLERLGCVDASLHNGLINDCQVRKGSRTRNSKLQSSHGQDLREKNGGRRERAVRCLLRAREKRKIPRRAEGLSLSPKK